MIREIIERIKAYFYPKYKEACRFVGEKIFKPMKNGDRVMWIILLAMFVISVLVVYSSSAKMAMANNAVRSSSSFLSLQLKILIGTMVITYVVYRVRTVWYFRFTRICYWLFIALTGIAYMLPNPTNGAARWIPLGPFDLQPSEGLKIFVVMMMARNLSLRQQSIGTQRLIPNPLKMGNREEQEVLFDGFMPILFPWLLAIVAIIFAHTSSAILVAITGLAMLILGRVKIKEILIICAIGVGLLGAYTMIGFGRSDTASSRVETWTGSWKDDRTQAPIEHMTDTERSMIAINYGGLIGRGAGQSAMRVEMIHPESDYAYAFFVEEYGLIMGIILLLFYLWIFFRAIHIYTKGCQPYSGLLILGLALVITVQALVHMAVAVNLAPETGQPLPLISRGGSSVLFTSIAIGMIIGVSRDRNEKAATAQKVRERSER